MANYRVYAKFPDMGKFKPLDLSKGAPVTNLIYATIIDGEQLDKTKEFLMLVHKDQPEVKLQIRDIESNNVVYETPSTDDLYDYSAE